MPEELLHVPTIFSPMHLCVHEWQTDDVHSWMDAGYASLSDAVHSGWPCHFQPPPPARPLYSQSRQQYVWYYSTFPFPRSLSRIFMVPPGTQGTTNPAVHLLF